MYIKSVSDGSPIKHIEVCNESPIRHVGLRWVSDRSPIGLRWVSDNKNIFVHCMYQVYSPNQIAARTAAITSGATAA